MSKIVNELKRRAEAQGLNVYQLSKLTGISRVTLYKIWHGNSDPRVSTIEKIVDALRLGVKKEPPPD